MTRFSLDWTGDRVSIEGDVRALEHLQELCSVAIRNKGRPVHAYGIGNHQQGSADNVHVEVTCVKPRVVP